MLRMHEQIYLPDNKEIHYFTKQYERGEDWYINHFKQAKAGQVRGEITPYYLYHEMCPERIKRFRKDIKLIVLLRDPVERALSQYFHSKRLGLEELDIRDALAAEEGRLRDARAVIIKDGGIHQGHQEHSYVSRSRYELQLSRYNKLFEKEQMLIIKSEDLFRDAEATTRLICGFLGIGYRELAKRTPKENKGDGERSTVDMETRLWLRYQLRSTYEWVENSLGIKWG